MPQVGDQVELLEDMPEHGLQAGQQGLVRQVLAPPLLSIEVTAEETGHLVIAPVPVALVAPVTPPPWSLPRRSLLALVLILGAAGLGTD